MKGLDFKDWMKVSADKKSTMLKHKAGHKMTIAHSALPKIQQEQLKRLKFAEGGGVEQQEDAQAKAPADAPSPSSVQPEAPAAAPPATNITINAAPSPQQQPGPTAASLAPGQQPKALPEEPSTMSAAPKYAGNGDPTPVATPNPNLGGGYQGIANQEQLGTAQKLAADSELANQQSKVYDTYLKQKNAQLDQQKQSIDLARAAAHRYDAYIQANPENKNRIFENMSVPGKITNALGLLIGGFAGGMNGTGVNPAMNYLMDQQKKDIESQKANLGHQKSAYEAYHQLFNDDRVASELAAVTYNDMLDKGLKQQALKVGTPFAMSNYNINSAALAKDTALKLGAVGQRINGLHTGQIKPEPNPRAAGRGNSAPPQDDSDVHTTLMKSKGASGDWSGGSNVEGSSAPRAPSGDNRLLPHDADSQIRQMSFGPFKDQQGGVQEQAVQARQAEKTLDAIDDLFPKMRKEATYGGDIARRINPAHFGAAAATAAEAAGALGAIPTAGASLLGAIPGAIAAGGIGTVIGSGAQTLARGIGGRQQTDYETDKANLVKIIKQNIPGIGDQLAAEIVERDTPNVWDSEENYQKKRDDLKDAIKRGTKTDKLERYLRNPKKDKGM